MALADYDLNPDLNAGSSILLKPGDWHGDAIRNIAGQMNTINIYPFATRNGAFSVGSPGHTNGCSNTGQTGYATMYFNASGSVPTAAENRTRAFATLGCVYTGEPT